MDVDIDLFIIDGELTARYSDTSKTQWFTLSMLNSGDWRVYNHNTDTEHIVITRENTVKLNNSVVKCDCEYNFYEQEVCKHMLIVGAFLRTDGREFKIINSEP